MAGMWYRKSCLSLKLWTIILESGAHRLFPAGPFGNRLECDVFSTLSNGICLIYRDPWGFFRVRCREISCLVSHLGVLYL
ncbi:hypothetical protein C7974DRAFT_397047 [Boeremia exigua]|uniref:uncharacterized protein n=1 Tax=Boeremia exigua TaxID=749465 RepID=UPI001E8CD923|nr:uncharacterized protein C7974DRAFT_397047 [Boeremia exigua]KAH6621737.1 hypothetical protein C7974DRAFT_397047 [Boeremia exigua]